MLKIDSHLKMLTTNYNQNNCNKYNPQQLLTAIRNQDDQMAKLQLEIYLKNPWINDKKCEQHFAYLHQSVKYNNLSIVKSLIEIGWDINTRDKHGTTPLLLAVGMRNHTIVELLLNSNADIYVRDNCGMSSLQCAAVVRDGTIEIPSLEIEDQRILEMLFEKVNRDYLIDKDRIGKLLLDEHLIVRVACLIYGSDDLTKFILTNDRKLMNYRLEPLNHTVLDFAIIRGKFDKAKILIEHGANIDDLGEHANSPLCHYPSKCQDLDKNSEVLKMLLERSKNVIHLEKLFTYGSKKTVRTVLQSGIEIPKLFHANRTVLHLLAMNEDAEAIVALEELAIKFDVDARDEDGVIALYCAASRWHVKQVEFLLERGADVHWILPSDETILETVATRRSCFQSD